MTVKRDSSGKDVLKAYKRVILKAQPDKGGTNKDFKTLQAAREKWEALRTTGPRDQLDGVGGKQAQKLQWRAWLVVAVLQKVTEFVGL